MMLLVGAIPVAAVIRTAGRRRGASVAWWEARDLLRAQDSPVTAGMTVRDLAGRPVVARGRAVSGPRGLVLG